MGIKDEKLLVFDGACGSNLHNQKLPNSVWNNKYYGCNEYLNISAPNTIVKLHRSFLDAGANVIETNTFGATAIVLSEYNLSKKVREINNAAVKNARDAIDNEPGKYIAGSIGPGTKLPSLGHIKHAEMAACYHEQACALIEAGVDAIIVETCQDLMQAKISIIAVCEAIQENNSDVAIMLSVTMEPSRTTLVGSDVATVASTFESFDIFSLGFNCATDPAQMVSYVNYLSKHWKNRISVIPNAGMPEVKNGQTFYPLDPQSFAHEIVPFVTDLGVSIVGGCCGTTPLHIKALSGALSNITPAKRHPTTTPSLSSLYNTVEIKQEIPPLVIGERMNIHGSRKFKSFLLSEDFEAAAQFGIAQEEKGAHLLDVCTAFAGRSEIHDMTNLVLLLNNTAKAPLVIDSTVPETILSVLKIMPGRCLINSINLEDGGINARAIFKMAKKYGAAVIALTIDENGMAMTAKSKLIVAQKIYSLAIDEFGLRPEDLFFDTLTFAVVSGEQKLEGAAKETIEAIKLIKAKLPGVFTSLGVSNVSFGLPQKSRKYLNSIFLQEAINAGLDAAIIDAGKIVSISSINKNDKDICHNLLYNQKINNKDPLKAYLDHFSFRSLGKKEKTNKPTCYEEILEQKVKDGDKNELNDILDMLLVSYSPIEIINQLLMPSMNKVGELFKKGKMLLPFVLASAEVMKQSIVYLRKYMSTKEAASNTKILLATVKGDVHDIGKNLVDIILTNNGYSVYNIGINVPIQKIIEKAKEHNVNIIGLSGLLMKSAIEMQNSMQLFNDAGFKIPILIGGAAITNEFVVNNCTQKYNAPVVYCPDAFSALRAVQYFETEKLKP